MRGPAVMPAPRRLGEDGYPGRNAGARRVAPRMGFPSHVFQLLPIKKMQIHIKLFLQTLQEILMKATNCVLKSFVLGFALNHADVVLVFYLLNHTLLFICFLLFYISMW